MLNFEIASFSSFRDFPKRSFWDGEVGEGSGGMKTIFSRPEAAGHVISGEDVDTFHCNACVNLCIVKFSSFQENLYQLFVYCADDGWST